MIGDVVGIAFVSKTPAFTNYLFGDISEIAGKPLRVWERNAEGGCLCLDPKGTSLVDVDSKDVDRFIDIPESSSFSSLMKMFMSDPV